MSLARCGHEQHTKDRPRPDREEAPKLKGECLEQALAHIEATRSRPVPPPILPEAFRPTSLTRDVKDLCDPGQALDEALLAGLAAKYFHVYATGSDPGRPSDLESLGRVFEQFARHKSFNEPQDDIETMNRLRRFAQALPGVGDLPAAAHLLRAFLSLPLPEAARGRVYQGLTLGAGAGLFILAQHIQARRAGCARIRLHGVDFDPLVLERTGDLCAELGLGPVSLAPAGEAAGLLTGLDGPLTVLVNEAIPALLRGERQEEARQLNKGLRAVLGRKLKNALCFPEALIAYAPEQGVSVLLSADNRYLGPREFRRLDLTPQGLTLEGQILPLHLLGQDILPLIPEEARPLLPRRW